MYILKEQRYSKSETTIKLRKERPMRKKVYAAWILAIIMVMSGVLCTQAETVFTGKAQLSGTKCRKKPSAIKANTSQ